MGAKKKSPAMFAEDETARYLFSGTQVVVSLLYVKPGALLRPSLVAFMTRYHLSLFSVVTCTAANGTATSFSPAPRNSADADDQRRDMPGLVDEHVHDLSYFVVGGVLDALFVPVGDRDRVSGYGRLHARARHRALRRLSKRFVCCCLERRSKWSGPRSWYRAPCLSM